ncbi:carboxyl transferase domain-containing protein [Microbispora sp. NPDC049125]|uniref:carboxyl transferase domain-containing protein n=1 Tax=Microbispora sp. NPDC049125 TaxID=3154929 RepID=UPI003464F9D9
MTVVAAGEEDAYRRTRAVTGLLAASGTFDLDGLADDRDPSALLPGTRACDIRPLVREILDGGEDGPGSVEIHARWAPNVVVGFGRLAGRSVRVVANDPLRKVPLSRRAWPPCPGRPRPSR